MWVSYQEVRRRCLKKDEAIKPRYARLVTHTFSTGLIWLFQKFPLTPNQISVAALVFAFAALPFFMAMSPISVLMGAILVELYYIFDAVDGQWARFKNQKSLSGAFLDHLGNYILQPFLFFSIGVGVFNRTGSLPFIFLGFFAGMASLWVMLIWDLRASVLLGALHARGIVPAGRSNPDSLAERAPVHFSFPRWLFSWLHKLLVFPWLMHVLSICAVAAMMLSVSLKGFYAEHLLRWFLFYYGAAGPLIAATLTAHWILRKKIDKDPILGV